MTGQDGTPELPESAVDRAAALVEQHSGMLLEGAHRGALRQGVLARMHATRCDTARAYLALLRDSASGELAILVETLAIPETRFFRHAAHFRALREIILPALAQRGDAVRLWSAGCSTGEEAYGLAITCIEAGLCPPIHPVSVLATDISRPALEASARALYPERQLAGITPERRRRHFQREGEQWRVAPHVRGLVRFAWHNLAAPALPLPPGAADVIFCQNVTIYFAPETTRAIARRLADALRDGGYLFPGFSETLWHTAPGLALANFGDCFAYRKVAGDARRETRDARRADPSGRALRSPVSGLPSAGLPSPVSRLPSPAASSAAEHLQQARRDAFEGNAASAIASAERAVALDVLLTDAWELLGLLRRQAGLAAEAERAFRRLLYLEPRSPLAHFHLATLYREAGRAADARREYANAARLLEALPPDTVIAGVTAGLMLKACRGYALREG